MGRYKKTILAEKEVATLDTVDPETEKRVADLIEKIRKGMPSVNDMLTQGFGSLRKHKEWEKYAKPYIKALEGILGRPVSVERYRPGR